MLRVMVDGVARRLEEGQTILHGLRSLEVEVPALCDDPRIEPAGACRVCIVEVSGEPRPVAACTTPLVEGMTIATRSPALERLRTELLRMLAARYPRSAVMAAPEKPFHRLLLQHGIRGFAESSDPSLRDESHPYIHVDMNQCITCFRCVRACEEVQGQFTWRVWNRGGATTIRPDSGTTLAESSCVACGACVDSCPSGALEDRSVLDHGAAERWTRTVCPYCGVGCEMEVGSRDDRVVTVRPALDAPVNRGHLCAKGRYAHAFVHAPDRVTSPMIRRTDGWEAVSWNEAVAFVGRGFRRILRDHGPDSLGVLASARASNEENYLAQKFARAVLGTNNVDCCARVCHAPSAAAMGAMLGTGAATNSFADIEHARTILLCGANATENHPVVGARIKQARLHGANLVVIDPRSIELAEYADVHLQLRPGTNVLLINALAHVVLDEGLADEHFLADRVDGLEAFRARIAEASPEAVAPACGVDPDDIRRAARMIATQRPTMSIHGLGVTEHGQGTDGVATLVNLALLTGNLGRPGAGMNPLRGQNNVQGAAHMGCVPNRLPGFVPLDDGRASAEEAWHAPVPAAPGLDALKMVDAAARGELQALWIIGWDVLLTNPELDRTRNSLRDANLVVVQDVFLNETAREVATVFLPACSAFEKDGTFMNAERRVQRVRRALAPRGDSKPDWEIICLVAAAMGHGERFSYHAPGDVWEEIRRVWPVGAGITYDRLDREGGLQWPCPTEDHPGTTVLHADRFPKLGSRTALRPVTYQPTPERTTAEFPFLLVTGRTLHQFNAGTMTMRTPSARLRPTDRLEVGPEDARGLGVEDGDRVRVTSRHGSTELPIEVTNRVAGGQVFATFHDPSTLLNRLIGPERDAETNTPEYKVTAVRVETARRRSAPTSRSESMRGS